MSSLLKSSAFSVAGSIVQFAVSVMSGVLVARLLGPTGKGEVFLILQFASLGGFVLSFGLGSSYLYHLRKEIVTISEATSHAFWVVTSILFFEILLYAFGLPLLRLATGHEVPNLFLGLLLLMILLNVVATYLGSILMFFSDGVQRSNIYSIVGGVAYLFLLVFFIALLLWGSLGALLAVGLSTLVRVGFLGKAVLGGRWRSLSLKPPVHSSFFFLMALAHLWPTL